MSSSVHFLLPSLLALVQLLALGGESDADCLAHGAPVLLQAGRSIVTKNASACLSSLYGLASHHPAGRQNVVQYEANCESDGCSLHMPKVAYNGSRWVDEDVREPMRSGFVFGVKPQPLSGLRGRIRLGLFRQEYNPSLVDLPAHLAAAFPAGRWLATVRVRAHLGDGSGSDAAKFAMTYAAVLDAEFRVLAHARVTVSDDPNVVDDYVGDARLLRLGDGRVVMSFQAYTLNETNAIVGELHTRAVAGDASDGRPALEAWLVNGELQQLIDCQAAAGRGRRAAVHKNVGMFETGPGRLGLLDWISPTQVGSLAVQDLQTAAANTSQMRALARGRWPVRCFSADWSSPPLSPLPWRGAVMQEGEAAYLGGSANPVWIEELGEFLGVGHFRRGWGSWDGLYDCSADATPRGGARMHHYSFVFFTLGASEPFELRKLSPEFCLASAHDAADCDAVQFVLSVARDGQLLAIGYGVMDTEAHVMKVELSEVLASLRNVTSGASAE